VGLLWKVGFEIDPWSFAAPNIEWVEWKNLGSHHWNFTVSTND
jgi:hypothetical protein